MTDQVPDTCTFDGRKWAVEHWDGDDSVIPTNKQLGITTVMVSTANYSGRIDHFVICRDKLYLLKVEVNLAQPRRNFLPKGAQREVLTRFENMRVFDKNGERNEIREYRFEYFVFHNLPVRYTGDMYLIYPCIDIWEQPYDADDGEDDPVQMRLTFDAGILVNAN
jgi:hypothetical protein